MKFTTALLAASLAAPLASATSILLPLYVYPSVSLNSWQPVYDAAAGNPDVDFYIIVNPDSGPGAGTYANDNSDYQLGLSKLNSYSNVRILGYVHTTYGADSPAAINANVTKYANWSKYTARNISVAGIFFDEVSATQSHLQYYTSLSDNAYDTIPSKDVSVVLNPGTNFSVTAYYDICDFAVVYECPLGGDPSDPVNGCKAYRDQTTINANVNKGFEEQAAILVRSYTGSSAQLNNSVALAAKVNIGAFYATKNFNYDDISLLKQQAAVLQDS